MDRELVFDVVSTHLTLHIVYYQSIHSYKPDCSILLLLVALKHMIDEGGSQVTCGSSFEGMVFSSVKRMDGNSHLVKPIFYVGLIPEII